MKNYLSKIGISIHTNFHLCYITDITWFTYLLKIIIPKMNTRSKSLGILIILIFPTYFLPLKSSLIPFTTGFQSTEFYLIFSGNQKFQIYSVHQTLLEKIVPLRLNMDFPGKHHHNLLLQCQPFMETFELR